MPSRCIIATKDIGFLRRHLAATLRARGNGCAGTRRRMD